MRFCSGFRSEMLRRKNQNAICHVAPLPPKPLNRIPRHRQTHPAVKPAWTGAPKAQVKRQNALIGVPPLSPLVTFPPKPGDALQRGRMVVVRKKQRWRYGRQCTYALRRCRMVGNASLAQSLLGSVLLCILTAMNQNRAVKAIRARKSTYRGSTLPWPKA